MHNANVWKYPLQAHHYTKQLSSFYVVFYLFPNLIEANVIWSTIWKTHIFWGCALYGSMVYTALPHLIVARLKGEGDYKVNHRGVHFGPYNWFYVMYGNNGHTISSATYRRLIPTAYWIWQITRNRGRVTYRRNIFLLSPTPIHLLEARLLGEVLRYVPEDIIGFIYSTLREVHIIIHSAVVWVL